MYESACHYMLNCLEHSVFRYIRSDTMKPKYLALNSNLMIPDCLCPVGCLSLEQRQDATKNQLSQSYSYIMRKAWYHQIRIQNFLGFIVSDLMIKPIIHFEPPPLH